MNTTNDKFDLEQWWKEQEEKLKKVSEIYNNYPIAKVFFITPEQMDKAGKLIKQHEKKKHKGKTPYAGAAGGNYVWQFSESGLGQTQGISCSACGEYLGLTDFSDW